MKTISRRRLLDSRKMDYYVHSEKFELIFKMANETEKKVIAEIIEKSSTEKLISFLRGIVCREIDNMNIKQLRNRAASLKIPHYWSMTKSSLILRILDVQATRADALGDSPEAPKEGTNAVS